MTSSKKQHSLKAINLLLVITMMLAGVAVNVSPVRAAAGDIEITEPLNDEVVAEGDTLNVAFKVDSTDNAGAGQYRILVGEEVFGPYGATFTGGVAQAFARTINVPAMDDGLYDLTVQVRFLGETEWTHSAIALGKVIVNNVDGIEITAPAEPVSVKSGDEVDVSFTVDTLSGDGEYDIFLVDDDDFSTSVFTVPVSHNFAGGYNQSFEEVSITIPSLDDGFYDLVVKAGVPSLDDTGMAKSEDILIVDNTIEPIVLTSPTGGEEWTIGSVHDITWEEYDPGEDVTISLFFSKDNGVTWSLIAADVPNADYSWTVPASATTAAKVKIEVVDGAGNKADDVSDAAFTIYAVDSTAPVVAMVAPEDGATIGPSVTLQASAADPESGIAQVEFFRDTAVSLGFGTLVGEYYEFAATLTAGEHTFYAVATNGIGLSTTSEEVSVTVEVADTTPPVVDLAAIDAVIGFDYEFNIKAKDNESDVVSMDLYAVDTTPDPDDEVLLCENVSPGELLIDGSRMFECTATAPIETDKIKAVVTNGAGLEGVDEADVIVDLVDPDLGDGLLTPAAGAVLQLGTSVDITWDTITEEAEANPDSVDLELRRGGVTVLVIAEDLAFAGFPHSWTIAGAPGSDYEVCMIAYDKAGNSAEDCNSPITIWGATTAPSSVSLTAPSPGNYKGTVTLTATASDDETFIQKVEFFVSDDAGVTFEKVGEDAVVPYDAGAVYEYDWDTTGFADGTYSIKAVATNGVGLQAEAVVDNVEIDNTAPVLSHMQPSTAAPISGNETFSITAIDSGVGIDQVTFKYYDAVLDVWDDMGTVSNTPLSDIYSVDFDTTGVDNGWLDIRVTAQDELGNEDSFEAAYFVQNGEPEPGQVLINLQVGWNLISLPLIPDAPAIEVLLADLMASDSVAQVVAWPYNVDSGRIVEMRWNGLQLTDITEIKDGPGYWIQMTKPGVLVFEGVPLPEPPMAMPEYSVYAGWNLIGFKSQQDDITAADYLGTDVSDSMRMMYGYDAATGVYTQVMLDDLLEPGSGYWMAVGTNGTIYPPAS